MVGGLAALIILILPLIFVPISGSPYFDPQIIYFGAPWVVLGSMLVTRFIARIRILSGGNATLVVAAALGLGGAWGMPALTFGLIQSLIEGVGTSVRYPILIPVLGACLVLVWVAVAVVVLRSSPWAPERSAATLHRIVSRVIFAIGLAIPVFMGMSLGGWDIVSALGSGVAIPMLALWSYLPGCLLGMLLASGFIAIARSVRSRAETAVDGPEEARSRRVLTALITVSLSTATLGWLLALDRVSNLIFSTHPGESIDSATPSVAITILMLLALTSAVAAFTVRAMSATVWLVSTAALLTAIALISTWI
ncbi:hypothetical protein D9V32_06025 [Mycetocola tolaasinivorans]|uniref:Uncharacterized protein n=2 Tax=Mycetocola tolaasinivorans TaxID=76635 RepID=A0A3L7AAR0_9MICO|nr:hypothetical protein D9V32_06025 [Mycetocola tolaasinivorans]